MEKYKNSAKHNSIIIILLSLLGLFFHQSARTGLGNNSLADIIIIFIFVYLTLSRNLFLPRTPIIIFLFFSSYIAIVSCFYVPIVFPVESHFISFLMNYIKLVVVFLFLILGYNLAKYKFSNFVISVYSYSAFGISIIGLVGSLLYIPVINELMFKYGTRLNGLMNDPNYFAILQITAIPYFVNFSKVKNVYRFSIIILLILSVILSGSKTGIIVLGIYSVIKVIERNFIFNRKVTLKILFRRFFLLISISICIYIVSINFNLILLTLNDIFPATNRITVLLNDFDSGISADGSGRDIAWKTGFEIIQLSPFLGVGIEHYLSISKQFFSVDVIAHNTYLQLAAEWGLPISVLFFTLIIFLLIYITVNYKEQLDLIAQRDIVMIFLLGSMSISLNNARFFWLVLGLIFFNYIKKRRKSKYHAQ